MDAKFFIKSSITCAAFKYIYNHIASVDSKMTITNINTSRRITHFFLLT